MAIDPPDPPRPRRYAGDAGHGAWIPAAVAVVPAAWVLLAGIPGPVDWGLAVLVPACLLLAWRGAGASQGRFPLDAPVVAFTVVWGLAGSTAGSAALRAELWLPAGTGLLLYWLTSRATLQPAHRTVCCRAFGLAALALAAWLLLAQPGARDASAQAWIGAAGHQLLVVPNDVIVVAAMALLAAGAGSATFWRTVAAAALFSALILSLQLQSRGAVLALLTGVAVLAALGPTRRLGAGLLAGCAGVMVAIEILSGAPLTGKFRGLFDDRLLLWASAWQQFLDHPWLGNGAYSFGELYRAPQAEKVRFLGQVRSIDPRAMPWPHNLPLEILAGGGLAASLAAGWIVARAARVMVGMRAAGHEALGTLAPAVAALVLAAAYELSLIRLWVVGILSCVLGLLSAGGQRES